MAATSASELSNDVLVDVLSRLPVKSLIRFKCVQKSWLALIESPCLVDEHSRQAISRSDTDFLLVIRELKEIKTNLVTLHPNGAAGNLTNITLPPLYQNHCRVYVVPGCVNGIICLNLLCPASILLWNPSTRDYWVIPENPISVPAGLDGFRACLGFGYDAKTDDYKVVRITGFWDEYAIRHSYLVEVYSLKTNLWRRVDAVMEESISVRSCTEIFFNGIHHWWASDIDSHGNEHDFLMGFDISKEAFCKIEFPDSLLPPGIIKNTSLAVLNNCIALIIYNAVDIHEAQCFEIWVMNKYGVVESWEKKFTTGPLLGLALSSPLGFWNDKKLLLRTQCDNILQYDLESKKIKILNINGVSSSIQVLNYTESLVSIKRDN